MKPFALKQHERDQKNMRELEANEVQRVAGGGAHPMLKKSPTLWTGTGPFAKVDGDDREA